MTTSLPADHLDREHIASAAAFAAEGLRADGVTRIRLAPGDMTEYRIVIASPAVEWAYGEPRQGRYYWVTLCANFGAGYEWHGGEIGSDYATEKWTNPSVSKGTRAHVGVVMALFLTAVAEQMAAAVPSV